MMPNITRGQDAGGLVRYLAGPGEKNEHTQQHVIGGSLGYTGDLDRDMVRQVTADLRAPGLAYPDVKVKAGEIWHCSLAIKAGEGVLSDEKWRAIADDFMQRMGFDDPKQAPARWVAVRHGLSAEGNDHIHIAASVIREDGRRVDTRRDWPRAQAAANAIEHAQGLDVLVSREVGVGSRGVSAAELRRAAAAGPGAVPDRVQLAATVRAAAGASKTELEFVRRLRGQGLQVRAVRIVDRKRLDLAGGPATGYAVARPGSNVWFGGGTLSRDLTLPRLRTGWAGTAPAGSEWAASTTPGREAQPVRVHRSTWRAATAELRGLEKQLRAGRMTPAQVADAAQAISGALSAAAGRPELKSEGVPAAARDAGRLAGSRAAAAPRRRLALSATLLLVQATERDSQVAQGIMVRQLMATYRAVQDAHRAIGAGRRGGVRMQSDGLDEPVEGLATVGVTIAARMIEAHARDKEQAARSEERSAEQTARTERAVTTDQPAAAVAEPLAVNAGTTADRSRPTPVERHPSQWATGDRALTPKQQLTLAKIGYSADELRGMSKSVASLHISGERSRADLGKPAPAIAPLSSASAYQSATRTRAPSTTGSAEQAPRRDPNLDLHRRRSQSQQQRRGR